MKAPPHSIVEEVIQLSQCGIVRAVIAGHVTSAIRLRRPKQGIQLMTRSISTSQTR